MPERCAPCTPAATENPPEKIPPVFLIGMMGVGKTTIGKQLASCLGRSFVDLDQAIEERCGVRIATIFDIEGEAGFRRRETTLLDEYSRMPGIVLATGGGVALAAENRQMLRERGFVIYLRADPEALYRRVSRDKNRPLLQVKNPRQRIIDLLEQRAPLYQSLADASIDTADKPISSVLRHILPLLQTEPAHPSPKPCTP